MMELVVDAAAEQAEIAGKFQELGEQFRLFYKAMRASGLPKKLARKLTASYGEVVCDLLYADVTDGG